MSRLACAACSFVVVSFLSLASVEASSSVYSAAPPWQSRDVSAGYPSAFDVTSSGEIVALQGLSVNLLSSAGVFERTIGTVPTFDCASAFGAFARISPDGSQVWVGFTVSGDKNDRIYSLPFAGGSATYQATLASNYDLEFAKVGTTYQPFVSGPNSVVLGAPNAVWLLNTSGGSHAEIVSLGGYGSGLAFDAAGNLYAMNQTLLKLYRFAAADVQKVALGLAATMTVDNAAWSTSTALGGSDITVDGAGHVFFNANGSSTIVGMLQPGYAGDYKYDNIATGITGYNWASQIAFGGTGDATKGQGAIYLNDWAAPGTLTALSVPEPATMLLAATAVGALAIRRRKSSSR